MEGSYNRVLSSGDSYPVPYYAQFTKKLMHTARHDIADTLQIAYGSLKVEDAGALLMLRDMDELESFTGERGWKVENGMIDFKREGDKENSKVDPIRSITRCLTYATELERII
eukprot:TRINITY_DN1026_c0_g1_i7.p2 TRINITY_DN1026_c0_g1~~TRINITY_DN1026_c0_g1_i7.p2  ORF type:complete len:113 (-),score=18.90 TRINITY_DN1026_c0_g1_i7:413-751(-)